MRYVLSLRARDILQQFAASRVLLAFDFDGTLAPIVDDPGRARMCPTTRTLLRQLVSLRTCLVLSGRSRTDLRHKLAGTGVSHLIGNHGAEPWDGGPRIRGAVLQWERALASELSDFPGLRIDNKTFSLTVHYRQCRRKAQAHAAILKAARSLPEVRLIGGKAAVSIVSRSAPHKGIALREELARLQFEGALYVGDDETDEDVFALDDGGPSLFAIRIGRKENSRAGYFLRNQGEIDELLRILLHLSSVR